MRTNQAKERRRSQGETGVQSKAEPKNTAQRPALDGKARSGEPRPPMEAKVRPVRSAQSGPLPPDSLPPVPAELHFGILLRRARERQGLSQQDVVRTTRIAERWLPALEEARLDLLPEPVFVTGYVRSYARLVGLDENDLVDRYQALTQQRSQQAALLLAAEAPPVEASPPPQRRALLVAGCLAGLLGLAVLLFALLRLRG